MRPASSFSSLYSTHKPFFIFFVVLVVVTSGFFLPNFRRPSPTISTSLAAAPHHHHLRLFLSSSTNATLSSFLRSLTLLPHLSPSPSHLRLLLSLLPSSFLLSSTSFRPLLSYPSSLSLSISTPTSSFPLPLVEPSLPPSAVSPYHAFSPSASLSSLLPVFVNFGRPSDYSLLSSLGVSVHGRLALARRGSGVSRAGAVRWAAAEGAVAVLLFRDDGETAGVERGTVMSGVGDALTPGWAAKEGAESLGEEHHEVRRRLPGIPSAPVSRECAEMVLRELRGTNVPEKWREEGLRVAVGGVGPGPVTLNFTYEGENKRTKIEDVFAVIRGSVEPDRYILLGNHRDAWTYGAVDPSSGTAALLDIARRFDLMTQTGWKPRRTIVLCSWDAEEFGMIGSTEWVEQNLVNAGSKAVAYLNVDCAVQGPGFFVSATPQLDDLLIEVTKMVMDPDREDATIFDTWTEADGDIKIERLNRADSDFAPFLLHAGVPSVDIFFGQDYPVYHTAYDTYEWMASHGDPTFKRHVAAAEIWGLLALRLADDPVLPFNYIAYVTQLQRYVDILQNTLDPSISLHPVTLSIELFASAAKEAADEAQNLREQKYDGESGALRRRAMNDRLMLAERGFLDPDGVPERHWFKHLVFGPPGDEESKMLQFFPGIADALSRSAQMGHEKGLAAVQHEVWRVARAIERAAVALWYAVLFIILKSQNASSTDRWVSVRIGHENQERAPV